MGVRQSTPVLCDFRELDTAREDRPALHFHPIHGPTVVLRQNNEVAVRAKGYCQAIAFSSRPITIGERVYLKILDKESYWCGYLRLGVTSHNPSEHDARSLPKYVCPDLTNKPGYWAKALPDQHADIGVLLCFWVTQGGCLNYTINGEFKGTLLCGINTREKLWCIFDIYGNTIGIQLIDPPSTQNSPPRGFLHNDLEMERWITPAFSNLCIEDIPNPIPRTVSSSVHTSNSNNDLLVQPLDQGIQPRINSPVDQWTLPLQHPQLRLAPAMSFHTTVGRHIQLSNDRMTACRSPSEFNMGYVFTDRPVNVGESVVIQILNTSSFSGTFAFGVTNCDPAMLHPSDLPDDSDSLLDRSEYWVVSKEVSPTPPAVGDKYAFRFQTDGAIHLWRNGNGYGPVFYVDMSFPLWFMFDLYGATQRLKLLDPDPELTVPESRPVAQLQPNQVSLPPQGELWSVGYPPSPSSRPISSFYADSHSDNIYAEITPVLPQPSSQPISLSPHPRSLNLYPGELVHCNECTICYEQNIDSVLYTCGHMCMCYECAVQQWRGRGAGKCPICRAVIKDVIRTYKP